MNCLFEVYVPTVRNDGRPIRTRFHRIWDSRVKAISGGLTIMPPTTAGVWVNNGHESRERMIPVRIACTREQLDEILKLTLEYYKQEAIFAYKISDEVIIYDGKKA